jgi:hypothetical protein
MHRDADWHRAHAVDEVRVGAARRRQHLDDPMTRQQLLPQDAQLQFGEPIADAAMDAEAEGQMLARPRPVDDEIVRILDRVAAVDASPNLRRPDRGSQVRTRLPAGGSRIRTIGPA